MFYITNISSCTDWVLSYPTVKAPYRFSSCEISILGVITWGVFATKKNLHENLHPSFQTWRLSPHISSHGVKVHPFQTGFLAVFWMCSYLELQKDQRSSPLLSGAQRARTSRATLWVINHTSVFIMCTGPYPTQPFPHPYTTPKIPSTSLRIPLLARSMATVAMVSWTWESMDPFSRLV